jgi:putative transposase
LEHSRKRSRFSEEQTIIGVLKQAENGRAVSDLVRELGATETTYYRWRRKFSGMEVSDARRLKELEEENRKLKRMVAGHALDIVALKDIVSKKMGSRRPRERRFVSCNRPMARANVAPVGSWGPGGSGTSGVLTEIVKEAFC